MSTELAKTYSPKEIEPAAAARWEQARAFHAEPAKSGTGGKPYSIVIPPPNVTAALHMGHALNNTLQDILTRWHRMLGDNTLWMPGTDHAGIATQTVVEKRVLAEEGKKRTDFQRDEFIARIQAWKDEYEATILGQLKAMGCSCDWERTRFTMDEQCARAVREGFFRLFKDGLIYRGKRLVNWDPATQTALADDEVEMQEIDGHFYYLRYPLVEEAHGLQSVGVPDYVIVATTRPETMLGDTAVAMHPNDPRAAALRGRFVRLPIVNRVVPIIEDEYVVLPDPNGDEKARFSSGFLKVTPAHDPNDYDLGLKHNLPMINVMAPDATISLDHGWPPEEKPHENPELQPLVGLAREKARRAVVQWFKDHDLLEDVKPYRHSVGHSYRSHVPIEPYLSDQWYVKVTDERLAGAALRAMAPEQRSENLKSEISDSESGMLRFSPARYAKTFEQWHTNIRDWCISRQLWWGHRIPVWFASIEYTSVSPQTVEAIYEKRENLFKTLRDALQTLEAGCGCPNEFWILPNIESVTAQICTRTGRGDVILGDVKRLMDALELKQVVPGQRRETPVMPAFPTQDAQNAAYDLVSLLLQLRQDPDVLDTWFSSGLWPLSTMGWPDETPELKTWNPTDVLCTAREIITLWVGRMVMFNLYFRGCLPFRDVFIHAMIQDGQGRKMSKSLGNGVDPLDIIHSHGADAMRFTLASMTTNTQDVRMPVLRDEATGRNTSDKFDFGRNFANKMWNAARFALSKLEGASSGGGEAHGLQSVGFGLAERWILSRLAATVRDTNAALQNFEFSQYAQGLYDFFWRDFCDWYIEAVKPTVAENRGQQRVLAACLDASLRLLHPAMPFITEKLWERLNEVVPQRGLEGINLAPSELLVNAPWPVADEKLIDAEAETAFALARDVVVGIRTVRAEHKVPPKQTIELSIKSPVDVATQLRAQAGLIETLANVTLRNLAVDIERPADAASTIVGPSDLFLHGLIDADAERTRLTKRLEELDRSVKTLAGRLANKAYLDKAPANLVEQTRTQLAETEREAQTVRRQLAALN